MKKLLVLAFVCLGFSGFAQCNLDLVLTSSKTEYLDGSGTIQRSVDENSTIEITKTQMLITPGSGNTMTGKITSTTCNWTTAFKEGKSVIKADFEDGSGNTMHATMTIEGKGDKVTFTMEIAEMADRVIKVNIDSFKEKK
ncbi:hypothetical protein [Emticicia sp. C21]|uniref:hypothetical protein n=1 Tax=Emticicia sp. C21 TaxID=2302915 RepID=UPI000E343C62|nr:hypothetical protein [Emticicia sp. C21]RFS15009.1 hypothetical protein D0T08_18180 [Emticicia sp. C21]